MICSSVVYVRSYHQSVPSIDIFQQSGHLEDRNIDLTILYCTYICPFFSIYFEFCPLIIRSIKSYIEMVCVHIQIQCKIQNSQLVNSMKHRESLKLSSISDTTPITCIFLGCWAEMNTWVGYVYSIYLTTVLEIGNTEKNRKCPCLHGVHLKLRESYYK